MRGFVFAVQLEWSPRRIQSHRFGVLSDICQHWGKALERPEECDYKAITEDVLCI